jgi:prepilin signal peptidase PulO-like enzyme (type II secretory pathway)
MSNAGVDGWSEGSDGQRPTYRERLYPPALVFLLVIGLASLAGIAWGAAYGAVLGWGVGALFSVIGIGVLLVTSTRLHVDDTVLRAGRARLPLAVIDSVQTLDADAMRQARRHGDPRDYLVLRAWSSRSGVTVVLADAHDPHPRWVLTTRHPERLAEAIRVAAEPANDTPPGR